MTNSTANQNLVERLFAAGGHFGFKKSRRHPSVKPYLFGSKEGTDIFDLERSASLIEEAKAILKTAGAEGKSVLFVGTKEEVAGIVKKHVDKLNVAYVTNRWVGGMITNWNEVKKRLNRLSELVNMGETGELERKYTKKERVIIGRELDKLMNNFGGIRSLERIPDLMVVVDPRHDKIAVAEANVKGIPIIAIAGSDNNLKLVNYPIVVNDTLRSSVDLVLEELAGAYTEGKSAYSPKPVMNKERRRIAR